MSGGGRATPPCSWRCRRWLPSALLLGALGVLGPRLSFVPRGASRCIGGMSRAGGLRGLVVKARGSPMKGLGPGGGKDPVNNVDPAVSAQGQKYAKRFEDIFLGGKKLWDAMKAQGNPKKLYFIGLNGNMAWEVAESVCDSLAYIPAEDGTYMFHRKPTETYPMMKYRLYDTDKLLSSRSKIAPVDLFMDDEEKYRDLEHSIIKEFHEMEYDGYPKAAVIGESALNRPENVDILKQGIVIWLDVDPDYSWEATQVMPQAGGGLRVPDEDRERPPVWALAQGWDGDVDDAEGKLEYLKIVSELRKEYTEIADIRLRTDVPGIAENSYWGAERLIKAIGELLGIVGDSGESVEEEVLSNDLGKFLEGARLSKYFDPAMKWCDTQGAASIEDVVDNIPDFMEALKLKPLEKKRLEKAAAAAVIT